MLDEKIIEDKTGRPIKLVWDEFQDVCTATSRRWPMLRKPVVTPIWFEWEKTHNDYVVRVLAVAA